MWCIPALFVDTDFLRHGKIRENCVCKILALGTEIKLQQLVDPVKVPVIKAE